MKNLIIKPEKNIETISELDAILSSDEIFKQDFEKARSNLKHFLIDSAAYHIENNDFYARYCQRFGFSPSDLEDDLVKLPLIPGSLFKKHQKYMQSSNDSSIMLTTSSGTQGTISKVPRDNSTLMRFFASVSAGVQEVLGIEQSELHLYSLSPSIEEVEHLWISYVLAGVSVYFPSRYYVSNDIFEVSRLIDDLREIDKTEQNQSIVIVGPPALILDTTLELERTKGLDLGNICTVVTMGGWKSRQGEFVTRDCFDKRVTEAFGLASEQFVRDVYNMVELNSVIFECSHHRKHCPPWLFVRARNPKTLEVQPSGQIGILGFADPTPISYPGFILSDDFGRVHEKVECPCGITSDIIEIERRINKLESRGCALKI